MTRSAGWLSDHWRILEKDVSSSNRGCLYFTALITLVLVFDTFRLHVFTWTLFARRSRARTGRKIVAVDVAAAVYMNNSVTHFG
jgi:hypothetical protein